MIKAFQAKGFLLFFEKYYILYNFLTNKYYNDYYKEKK